LSFGMIYYLVPRLWKTELYSKKLLENHFWIGLTGILLYYISMVTAGITQGLMWRAVTKEGTLVYPDFIETVVRIVPLYWVRALGGCLFIIGFLLMAYNIFKTIQLAPKAQTDQAHEVVRTGYSEVTKAVHRNLEGMGLTFSVLAFLAIAVGSIIEIYPTLALHKYITPADTIEPYTPLEIAGRDIYLREGCYLCHSQQIRPIVSEVLRYGKASTVEESMYDHPFQWGSKRTGPDLARLGKKYPNLWHYTHMMDPRSVTQKSIMPNYPWLAEKDTDFFILRKKMSVMKNLGVPYEGDIVANADIHAQKQALEIAQDLEKNGGPRGLEKKEIIALIAYLQSLGQKGKAQ
ncbi:MAG TPA: cytochrome-c oxidase, cbb3-type subunit II, partial [Bdellovibrio sp.]|nr:cytochrome-c oxidase, cbb3-type subunit II [Bdellovibrio sp.]